MTEAGFRLVEARLNQAHRLIEEAAETAFEEGAASVLRDLAELKTAIADTLGAIRLECDLDREV